MIRNLHGYETSHELTMRNLSVHRSDKVNIEENADCVYRMSGFAVKTAKKSSSEKP